MTMNQKAIEASKARWQQLSDEGKARDVARMKTIRKPARNSRFAVQCPLNLPLELQETLNRAHANVERNAPGLTRASFMRMLLAEALRARGYTGAKA